MNILELDKNYLKLLKDKIEDSYDIAVNGCWEWNRGRAQYGYGKISVAGKTLNAHRTYYQLVKGEIGEGLVVSHLCDNPPCINPDHLDATTQWENNARGSGPSAQNIRKTHCKNGHEFTEWNTRLGKNRRSCRLCARAHSHKRDIQRTKGYHAKGLGAKGKPIKRLFYKYHKDVVFPTK